jgi:hypothetical protein
MVDVRMKKKEAIDIRKLHRRGDEALLWSVYLHLLIV